MRTQSNRLYIGHTNNIERREWEHQIHPHGAKFLKDSNETFRPVYLEEFSSRAGAMKREAQIKKWSRAKKEALIAGDLLRLKLLAKC
jgi:predicted GIY-YIG superfamily endonuclease